MIDMVSLWFVGMKLITLLESFVIGKQINGVANRLASIGNTFCRPIDNI